MKKFSVKKALIGLLTMAEIFALSSCKVENLKNPPPVENPPVENPPVVNPPVVNPDITNIIIEKEDHYNRLKRYTKEYFKSIDLSTDYDVKMMDFKDGVVTLICENDKTNDVKIMLLQPNGEIYTTTDLIKSFITKDLKLLSLKTYSKDYICKENALVFFEKYVNKNELKDLKLISIYAAHVTNKLEFVQTPRLVIDTSNHVRVMEQAYLFYSSKNNEYKLLTTDYITKEWTKEDLEFYLSKNTNKNYYDFYLDRIEKTGNLSIESFSGFANSFVKYQPLQSNVESQLSDEEKEKISKQEVISKLENYFCSKLFFNNIDIKFLDYNVKNEDLVAYFIGEDGYYHTKISCGPCYSFYQLNNIIDERLGELSEIYYKNHLAESYNNSVINTILHEENISPDDYIILDCHSSDTSKTAWIDSIVGVIEGDGIKTNLILQNRETKEIVVYEVKLSFLKHLQEQKDFFIENPNASKMDFYAYLIENNKIGNLFYNKYYASNLANKFYEEVEEFELK